MSEALEKTKHQERSQALAEAAEAGLTDALDRLQSTWTDDNPGPSDDQLGMVGAFAIEISEAWEDLPEPVRVPVLVHTILLLASLIPDSLGILALEEARGIAVRVFGEGYADVLRNEGEKGHEQSHRNHACDAI